MSSLAPIAIFAYNRPWHIQQTIESLKRDDLASQSDVYIFSDAAKNFETSENVEMVRQYLRNISGFKSLKIVKREENWGQARSITEGITEVINEHGRIIVLEDDVVVSTAFLTFMNKALDYYQFNPNIWHISGYNYPMRLDTDEDAFLAIDGVLGVGNLGRPLEPIGERCRQDNVRVWAQRYFSL